MLKKIVAIIYMLGCYAFAAAIFSINQQFGFDWSLTGQWFVAFGLIFGPAFIGTSATAITFIEG